MISQLGKQYKPFGGAGFLIVLVFLGVGVVAAAVLILVPLMLTAMLTRQDRGPVRARPWTVLLYFFLLGLAFMGIVLPLMQQLILLLDQPTYSFGVVLFAVLVFSGLGSLLSPRLGTRRGWAILGLGALALVYATSLSLLSAEMLMLPLGARIPIVVLTIAPLAVLMGIPFPSGIAALESDQPGLIPWAWGVNGYASVIGSMVATLAALSWGFSEVMLMAAGAYLAAGLVYQLAFSAPRPAERTQRDPDSAIPSHRPSSP